MKIKNSILIIVIHFLFFAHIAKGQNNYTISGTSDNKIIEFDFTLSPDTIATNINPIIGFLKPQVLLSNSKKDVIQTNKQFIRINGFSFSRDGSGMEKISANKMNLKLDKDNHFNRVFTLKPGSNSIVFEAYSNNGLITLDTLNFQYTQGKDYIFSIAVDNYANWSTLDKPVSDAKNMVKVLTDKYQFDIENTIEVYNEGVTKDSLDILFRNIIEKVTEHDNLIIFYAGHGYYDNKLKEGYWVPVNANINKSIDYVSNASILNYIAAIDSKHTLLLSDACFSGTLLDKSRGVQDVNFANFDKRKSRWVFTSGGNELVSDNSPFVKYIINYLENNNKEKFMMEEMANIVIKQVQNNSNQLPFVGPLKIESHDHGQYVFILKQ